MMLVPKVSIVIVNWRTPLLLRNCLQTLSKDEQAASFEIYVIDNASGDESLSILAREFPYVKVIANTQNLGFSKACNQAISKAKGEYILLLNPDTLIVDSAISKLAMFLDSHADCGAVGPKVLNEDGTLQLACRRSFPSPAAAFFRLTYLSKLFPEHPLMARYNMTYTDPQQESEVDVLSGSGMMVRKKVVDQVGLLDEDIFMHGEDIDWCWRIKQGGWQIFYYPEAVIYHIHGASSRLRPVGATFDFHKGMAVFYRKHLAKNYWPIFNQLVYLGIWLRAFVFVIINLIRAQIKTPARQVLKETQKERQVDKASC
jgi:GT2 family glycosyltransferase